MGKAQGKKLKIRRSPVLVIYCFVISHS
jgi:hypothetical protein